MQASINASEIRVRDQVREDLNLKVREFLKSGSITKVGTGTVKTETRPQFNHIIAVAPTKRAERQQEKRSPARSYRRALTHRNRRRNANQVSPRSVCPAAPAWIQIAITVSQASCRKYWHTTQSIKMELYYG